MLRTAGSSSQALKADMRERWLLLRSLGIFGLAAL
jgi:hypothetical protein